MQDINQDALQHVLNHPDLKVLQRVPFTGPNENVNYPILLSEVVGDEIDVVILDLETTGLKKDEHEIIELGLVKVSISPSTGSIAKIYGCLSLFEQPSQPITEEITKITGITNEMVEGQKIEDSSVEQIFGNVALVIAHNASFDRGFFDKRFPTLSNLPWACSIKDMDWTAYGLEGNKLLYLLYQCGYFYEAHRADIDCIATLRLFQSHEGSIKQILHKSLDNQIRIRCYFAPYHVKDELKERGYRWDTTVKSQGHWRVDVPEADFEAEMVWLRELCPKQAEKFRTEHLTRFNRYK